MILSAAINLMPSIMPSMIPREQPVKIVINIILLAVALFVMGKLKWHPAIGLGIGAIMGIMVGFLARFS